MSRIKGRRPGGVVSLAERVANRRRQAELDTAIDALKAIGADDEQAMTLVVQLGSAAVITTAKGRGPVFVRGACPLASSEAEIERLRQQGVKPSLLLVSPEDHAAMARQVGTPQLLGANGQPMGKPPVLAVSDVLAVPWPAQRPGWVTIFDALLQLEVPEAPPEMPMGGQSDAPVN